MTQSTVKTVTCDRCKNVIYNHTLCRDGKPEPKSRLTIRVSGPEMIGLPAEGCPDFCDDCFKGLKRWWDYLKGK